MNEISTEAKEKLKKHAMHELVPRAALYFTKIPLTTAGKIRLAQFPNNAIKHAEQHYNPKLNPTNAYKDLSRIATEFATSHHLPLNPEAVTFLSELYGVKPTDPSTRTTSSRPENLPYVHKPSPTTGEPVYISYFKLKEHLTTHKIPLANPYEAQFRLYLKEAISSANIDPETIEAELYKMYLKQKDSFEIRSTRKTNPSCPTTSHPTPHLRPPSTTETRLAT